MSKQQRHFLMHVNTSGYTWFSNLLQFKHSKTCRCMSMWSIVETWNDVVKVIFSKRTWKIPNGRKNDEGRWNSWTGIFFVIPRPCWTLSLRSCYCRWCVLQFAVAFGISRIHYVTPMVEYLTSYNYPRPTLHYPQPEGVAETTEETTGCESCRFQSVPVHFFVAETLHIFFDRTESKQFLEGLKIRLCKLEGLDKSWQLLPAWCLCIKRKHCVFAIRQDEMTKA